MNQLDQDAGELLESPYPLPMESLLATTILFPINSPLAQQKRELLQHCSFQFTDALSLKLSQISSSSHYPRIRRKSLKLPHSRRPHHVIHPELVKSVDRGFALSVAREVSAELAKNTDGAPSNKKGLVKVPQALWRRYVDWLYQHKELGLFLDVSRVGFTDEFVSDRSLRGNVVDLPDDDHRVRRRVNGFEPEQISVSLSADYDSVWISWITGEYQIGDNIKPLDPKSVQSVVQDGELRYPPTNEASGYSLVYNQLYPFEGLQNYTSGIIHHVRLTGHVRGVWDYTLLQGSRNKWEEQGFWVFVQFEKEESAMAAVNALNDIIIKRKNQTSLYEALQKIKEELMLLGFISLLLTVFQNLISKFCVSEGMMAHLWPCRLPGEAEKAEPTSHLGGMRRLFAEEELSQTGYCAKKHKVPLLSLEALHHLHIFIFVLAIVHVTFCVLTVVFGGIQILKRSQLRSPL